MKSVLSSLWVLPLLHDLCASGLRCLVPALSAQFVQPQQPLVVGTAFAVIVYPAPCVGGEGHGRLVYKIYLVYRELCLLVQYTCPIVLPLISGL